VVEDRRGVDLPLSNYIVSPSGRGQEGRGPPLSNYIVSGVRVGNYIIISELCN